MPYDPDRHHRRSIRLKGYDYTQAGAYFVTIVTYGRELLFDVPLLRSIAGTMWQRIPRHFTGVELDKWVVMPNHIHGIIVIADAEATRSAQIARLRQDDRPNASSGSYKGAVVNAPSPRGSYTQQGSLGAIAGNFKSVTARRINQSRGAPRTPVWQRNYYERIIRDEDELRRAREYIANNPTMWEDDPEHPSRTLSRNLDATVKELLGELET